MEQDREKELLEIGEEIRKLRRSRDYSQEVLAEAMEVSTITISRIENGTAAMNVLTLKRMAEVLQVPVGEIIKVQQKCYSKENTCLLSWVCKEADLTKIKKGDKHSYENKTEKRTDWEQNSKQ